MDAHAAIVRAILADPSDRLGVGAVHLCRIDCPPDSAEPLVPGAYRPLCDNDLPGRSQAFCLAE